MSSGSGVELIDTLKRNDFFSCTCGMFSLVPGMWRRVIDVLCDRSCHSVRARLFSAVCGQKSLSHHVAVPAENHLNLRPSLSLLLVGLQFPKPVLLGVLSQARCFVSPVICDGVPGEWLSPRADLSTGLLGR